MARRNLPRLPHPVVLLGWCPQLRRVIEELEAGTYPQPDDAVWRPDIPRDWAVRLAEATGATAAQIGQAAREDDELGEVPGG